MSATFGGYRFQYPPDVSCFFRMLAPASLAISVGDMLYWNGTVGQPISAIALLATSILDQANVVSKFLGIATSGRIAAQTTSVWPADYVEVCPQCIYLADCASATWEIGDLVGIIRNAGATALLDQNVIKVTTPNLAIGEVVRREPTAVTSVLIRIFGKAFEFVGGNNPNTLPLGGRQGSAGTVLTDANQTLTPASNPVLSMVPTAARNVTLPVEAQSQGLTFSFTNNSAGAFSVTFQTSAAGTIKGNGVVPQNKTGLFWYDTGAASWTGMVSA